MKLQDLTIDQFQRIAALEFSPVLTDYDKRAGVVAIVEGVDVSIVREMPAKGLTKRYKTIIAEWNELPTLAYRRRFKAGGKWWIPTVFTDELTAGQYADHSLDFVYIDADHSYASVVEDITAWKNKVKQGGFIAGHDSYMPEVLQAVRDCLGEPDHFFTDTSWLVKL